MGKPIDWNEVHAAIWRPRKRRLKPVTDLDRPDLGSLVGIERQAGVLMSNTRRFVTGRPANNALLWGARGTGKSSLIKAVFSAHEGHGLRLIEVDRDDLQDLSEIVDGIRDSRLRFLIYCDDLTFEPGETGYRSLKKVLEGSIERPPSNLLVYATSNRRHLVPEYMRENLEARVQGGEVHYGDATEDRLALSDRFGLWLAFHPVSQDTYLAMVDRLFADWPGDQEALHAAAKRFALARGSRSGRTASQFRNSFEPPIG